MDEKGYSWPEALLTLSILIVIFGTLLPLATKITSALYSKKQSMHATETAYQGAIMYDAFGVSSGTRSFEENEYDWIVSGKSICVSYWTVEKVKTKCVD